MLHAQAVAPKRSIISRRNAAGQDLPIAKGMVQPTPSSLRHASYLTEPVQRRPKAQRQILIVGDSPGLCSALARSLRHPELRVRTAGTRATALAILAREKIDFVIAELSLSPEGGIDLLETVRLEFPHATRVLITGECDIAVIREAIRRSDVSFFLGKPWDAQSLRELVRNLLLVEWSAREQESATVVDFEAEFRAHSVSAGLSPARSFDMVCDSLAQARSVAEANFAQCETQAELAAVLDRAFAQFVDPHELWWWDRDPGSLAKLAVRQPQDATFLRGQLAPKLARVLDSIDGSSRPFVLGLNRMIAAESASSRKVLVIPVIAGSQCLASVLIVGDESQSISGWPLDLAECLTDALGPTLLRIRRSALNRTERSDRDQRIAERLRESIALMRRALENIEPLGRDDRRDREAVQFIRSETLELNHIAEELQGINSSEHHTASRRE